LEAGRRSGRAVAPAFPCVQPIYPLAFAGAGYR